jgi:hypothetical protein
MDAKDFLFDRSDKAMRSLFKGFLVILEDLQREHSINFAKLYDSLPEEYEDLVGMADYLDDERFAAYRKKVLDLGNEIARDHQCELENFQVQFIFK